MKNRQKMYIFIIEATPKSDNSESKEFGGAYAVVWVSCANVAEAEAIARSHIQQETWEPGRTTKVSEITRDNYASNDPALDNFDEAIEWGSSLVLHTWPRDCEDADVEY